MTSTPRPLRAGTIVLLLASNATSLAHAQSANELDPVVVTATRIPEPVSKTLSDATVVDREEIERSGQSSLVELLARQPGVEFSRSGGPGSTTDLFIRGTKTAQTAVLIDGLRLVNPTNGTGMIEFLPLENVDRVEIVRGATSGLYGSGAIGGTVQIFTRDETGAPKWNASLGAGSYRSYRSSLGYGGTVGDTSFYGGVAAEGARGFSASKSSAPSFVFEADADGNKLVSGNLRLSQRLAPGHKLRLSGFQASADTDVDLGVTTPPQPFQKQFVRALSVVSDNQITDAWRSQLTLGKTTINYEYVNAGFTFAPHTGNSQINWLNEIALPVGKLVAGIERQRQSVFGPGVNYLRSERTVSSGFAGYGAEFGQHSINLNLRRDHWSDFGSENSGSISYGFRPLASLQIGGTLARAFRVPTFDDLFFPCTAFGCPSNPDLRPERSRNVELWARLSSESTSAGVTLFQNRVHDAIELDGSFVPQNVEARIRGITLSADTRIEAWRASGSVTLQDPKDVETGNQLARRAKRIANFNLERAIGALTLGGELQLQDKRYDNRVNSPSNRMGGYGLANVFAQYRVDAAWSALLRIGNVFDKEYELAQNYNTPGVNAFLALRYSPR